MQRTSLTYDDISAITRLACDAIIGATDVVEAMHNTIASRAGTVRVQEYHRKLASAALVYWGIRSAASLIGTQVDSFCSKQLRLPNPQVPLPKRESLIATLNGVFGDHLAATDNPFAIKMQFRKSGLPIDPSNLADSLEPACEKVVIMVHGSCMSDLQWQRNNHSYGDDLARDLGLHPIYLHYNSGLHVSTNGRRFAALLESFAQRLPDTTKLYVVAHSMGGLVTRSACHYARESQHGWIKRLKKIVFLATPHHGAPLEVSGNWVDYLLSMNPYSAPLAKLGKIRSSGVTDLRYGNVLDEDWQGRDRFEFSGDQRRAVPLPRGVRCYAIAATLSKAAGKISDCVIGDGLVVLDSALGRHHDPAHHLGFAASDQAIIRNLGHKDILNHRAVYHRIRDWLAEPIA